MSQSKPSFLDKTKHGGKAAFDKGWGWFEKLGAPVNKLTNKIGSEAFWPTTLDHESDKCARILKSFCKDGFYREPPAQQASDTAVALGPKSQPKVLVKIPQKVIQNCVGLAIFTVMRTGLCISGAGGSGVLIAKKEDGSWSPPSGILIHTLGVGFMVGADIYDCVLVINNRQALEAFSKVRVSLGGEISVVAGPVGVGGNLETELTKNRKPIWTYMKSRGLYGGLQIDGTIVVERNDENARFYGEKLPVNQILAGQVRRIPTETRLLLEVLKDAEGRTDLNHEVLAEVNNQPPPSEVDVEQMNQPTAEQKQNFAPPPSYEYYPPEKTDSSHLAPQDYSAATPSQQGQDTYSAQHSYGSYQPTNFPPPPASPSQRPRPTSSSGPTNYQTHGYPPAEYNQSSFQNNSQQPDPPYGTAQYANTQQQQPGVPYFPPPPR